MRLSFYYAVVLLAALSLLLPPVRATCPFPDTFSQHTKLLDSGSPGQASYFWCNYTGRTHYLCYGQNVTINPKDNAIYGTSGSVGPNLPFESLYDRKFEFNPRKENSPACPIKRDDLLWFPEGPLDLWNPFEGSHQILAAFLSMRVTGRYPKTVLFNTELEKMNINPETPTTATQPLVQLWKLLFPGGILDVKAGVICAGEVLVGWGCKATLAFPQNTCHDKRLTEGFREWIMKSIPFKPGAGLSSSKGIKILFAKRQKWQNRYLQNSAEITQELQKLYDVHEVVLHELPVVEQLALIEGCDIFLSVHGGALSFLFALLPCGQVVEIFGQPHYQHMSKLFQRGYHSVSAGIGWGTREFSVSTKEVQEGIRAAVAAWERCNSAQ